MSAINGGIFCEEFHKMTDFEQTSDGRIAAGFISTKKSVKKTNILLGSIIENFGLEPSGDLCKSY
jgi:hypothetical protein